MNDFAADCATLLARELDGFAAEVDLFPDDESLWRTPPGVANSAGNLAMHVAGNLQHFIGAILGKTGYVRDRDLEFSRRAGSREMVRAELARAEGVVADVLPRLDESVLSADYPLVMIEGKRIATRLYLHHLCVHAGFHLGQAGLVRRTLLQNPRSSGPLSLQRIMRAS